MPEESFIWTEKYRPQTFESFKGQDEVVKRVKAFVEQKNLPHMLFAGPAGVGKSTLALVAARQLYSKEWRQNFLELNASDERGIDVIRVKVKDFARTKAIGDVPFKIIFLDECDALTREAQQALRRTMENYTATARFIMSCNTVSKVIEPIQSRCVVFKFKPLEKQHVFDIIDRIAQLEKLNVSEEAKNALYDVSGGDCRQLENAMQSCAAINSVTPESVYAIASVAKPQEIKTVLELAVNGDFLSARNRLFDVMHKYGLSGLDVVKQLQKEVWSLSIPDNAKVNIIAVAGDAEFRMVEGSDDFIQLEALLAKVVLNGVKKER